MRSSSEYKREAKIALEGKWKNAALANFITSLFFGDNNLRVGFLSVLIGGPLNVGYANFNLKLVEGRDANVSDLSDGFNHFVDNFVLCLLRTIFVALWSLLFLIPGIVKSFAYSLSNYIRVDHPELSATDTLGESERLMYGHKTEQFFLRLSFIGWRLLASSGLLFVWVRGLYLILPKGWTIDFGGLFICLVLILASSIATYFVNAYENAALAVYYKDVLLANKKVTM